MTTAKIPTLEEIFGKQTTHTDVLNQLKNSPRAYENF